MKLDSGLTQCISLFLLLEAFRMIGRVMPQSSVQSVFALPSELHWNVQISNAWDVLGPFPTHAREQYFLSPSFPINLSQPIDIQKIWPSSYADGGMVGWSTAQMSNDGILKVSFPDIRWKNLRDTEGWAALQHHAVLKGSLTITPPDGTDISPEIHLLVQLKQSSYFTILPSDISLRENITPQWHAGNIYDMERALPRAVELPTRPFTHRPTQYDIIISGDYEIRLFGDPRVQTSTEIPTQTITLSIEAENKTQSIIREPSQDVICDFVEGIGFGKALGLGLRSIEGWWTVQSVISKQKDIRLDLKDTIRIASSQTRIVPILLHQRQPFHGNTLDFDLVLHSSLEEKKLISISLPITNHPTWPKDNTTIKATYFFADTMPTAFLAKPPITFPRESFPPILALHGAGVDILTQPFWEQALPTTRLSWTVIPTGRTSWGLDWHGPSARDAWDCVDTLADLLHESETWKSSAFERGTPVVLLGHSNGGQGAWYLASRFPDRILAVVPAAGFIKSQAYIPLTMSRSAHYIDPALRFILESSLTPDDDDLFLTNLASKPVLAVHGGDDDNVPTWHSRESVSVVKSWSTIQGFDGNVSLKEDIGERHFYPTVFNNSQTREFIEQHTEASDSPPVQPFTLTTVIPGESGTLNGWKIDEVNIPGRLARLSVHPLQNGIILDIETLNVKQFSINTIFTTALPTIIRIDMDEVALPHPSHQNSSSILIFNREEVSGGWKLLGHSPRFQNAPTRLQSFLSTNGVISFVISDPSNRQHGQHRSMALRLAHDLHIHHRLDTTLILASEIFTRSDEPLWPEHNFVLLASPEDEILHYILDQGKTPFRIHGDQILLNDNVIRGRNEGYIILHPHPASSQATMLIIIGASIESLERAMRLFPIRTGILAPSWMILNPLMDTLGEAGISGAGVWGNNWTWNNAFSWCKYF